MRDYKSIINSLVKELRALSFSPPVVYVYNPLEYARQSYEQYLERYAGNHKEIIFIGMNPGPWGMAQTGVPFGEVNAVKDWLKIDARITTPTSQHPKRPVLGFNCTRSEVSGRRLWGWAKNRFKTPEKFFSRFIVANYCPLMFLEESGRNRTPDKIPVSERKPMLDACDRSLKKLVQKINPRMVIGIGNFAERQAQNALGPLDIPVGRITHPSPANPRANRNWEQLIESELKEQGIDI